MQLPSEVDVAVIGAGAAGVAAGRRLRSANAKFIVLEARARVGGRAWTAEAGGFPLDLGCGWLHSADRNPWTKIAEAAGFTIDRTAAPWSRPALEAGFPAAAQEDFHAAAERFYARMDEVLEGEPDKAAADLLKPGCKWNALLNAISTYANGAELDLVSTIGSNRFDDTGVNWRVVEGLGAAIAHEAAALPVVLDCTVNAIDHGGRSLRIETARGTLAAKAAIVTLPSALLAADAVHFTPTLAGKREAAAGLPLGLADKLMIALDQAEEFPEESRIVGNVAETRTAIYHLRPFGRPMIEGYFAGRLAEDLEHEGEGAFLAFAAGELANLLGNGIRRRLHLLAVSSWRTDPLARGSYSYASPGHADDRAVLAAPVNERLFFAGEACSPSQFSTAHGAYETGVAAAEAAMAALAKP